MEKLVEMRGVWYNGGIELISGGGRHGSMVLGGFERWEWRLVARQE